MNWNKHRIENYIKRLDDLKGRKSHQDFEVQRELVNVFDFLSDLTFWQRVRLMFPGMRLHKAISAHKECCGIDINDL